MTEIAMEAIGDEVDFYYNTPNLQSRPGYLKMGFGQWTAVVQHGGVVLRRRALLDSPDLQTASLDPTQVRTEISDAFFDWRYRQCPRYRL